MKKYQDKHSNSGIYAYELGDDFIRVQFKSNSIYLYTDAITGQQNVTQMKLLAERGRGLCTFISKIIKNNYAVREQ